MILYEDARAFRQTANLPLAWKADAPPPPRDRVEFTRLILEAAESAGLEICLSAQIGFEDSGKKLLAFQNLIHRYTYRQRWHGPPTTNDSKENEPGNSTCQRFCTWKEYIEELEKDYYEPWASAWRFGISDGREYRVLTLMKQHLAQYRVDVSRGETSWYASRYPDARTITGEEIVASYLKLRDGQHLSSHIRGESGCDIPLTEDRWLGIPGPLPYYLPPILALWGLFADVSHPKEGLYSLLWSLIVGPAILFLLILLTVVAEFVIFATSKQHWISKRLTFNQLAKKVVANKKREWDELQHKYAAPFVQ